jgi:hypothetical protein
MTQALLLILIAFSCAVGYGLAMEHASGWTMFLAAVAIWIAVPVSYVVTLLAAG